MFVIKHCRTAIGLVMLFASPAYAQDDLVARAMARQAIVAATTAQKSSTQPATPSAPGIMSTDDKIKLDQIKITPYGSGVGIIANASTATKLYQPVTINGVSFDGSNSVTLSAVDTQTPRLALSSNLSDLSNVTTARSNLGVTATGADPAYAKLTGASFTGNISSTGTLTANNATITNPINGSVTGNASTANKWTNARTLSVTGDSTWSMSLDGSGNVSVASTLSSTGVNAGSYGSSSTFTIPTVTVDSKGRVTAAATYTLGKSSCVLTTSSVVVYGTGFNTVPMTTASSDPSGGFTSSTGTWTVPETGTYEIIGFIRWKDSSTSGVGFAIGVGNQNADGPLNVQWYSTSSTTRQGSRIVTYIPLAAGDKLRLFTYVDNSSTGLGLLNAALMANRIN